MTGILTASFTRRTCSRYSSGPRSVRLWLREIRDHRRKLAIERVEMMDATGFSPRDLLLKERVQHDRGATCVLETAYGIQMIGKRGGAGHERIRET